MDSKSLGVRPAEMEDLAFIRSWLADEESEGRGFIHNWHMIEEAQQEDDLLVFEDSAGVVGFLSYGLSRSSILQVRSDHKGKGIGRALVERALADELVEGNMIQVIQCEPQSSLGFWRRMGFVPTRQRHSYRSPSNIYLRHVSTLEHPAQGTPNEDVMTLNVWPSKILYDEKAADYPDQVHYAGYIFDEDNLLLSLDHRICIVHEEVLEDAVIEVLWGGATIYFSKAKRDEAADMGLIECPNGCGWYIDEILIPQPFIDARIWPRKG